jgi:regulatory protein
MTAQRADGPSDPEQVARTVCLQLLAKRARTRHELEVALGRRGVPDGVAARVLDRFAAVGLLDDGAYAEQWVRSRHELRGLGRRALAAGLRRKGVDGEIAGEALSGIDRAAERQRARELVDRRLRTLPVAAEPPGGTVGRHAADDATARKLVGVLARKGYPAGLAYEVVREALAARGGELSEVDPTALEDG